MSCYLGAVIANSELSYGTNAESELVEHFTLKLLGAKFSAHEQKPWVMVTPIHKAKMMLSVYLTLERQGEFSDWSNAFFDIRQDSGICVLVLVPPKA